MACVGSAVRTIRDPFVYTVSDHKLDVPVPSIDCRLGKECYKK